MRLSVADIAKAVSGEALAGSESSERIIEGVTWDSRTVAQGCLYVALPGERVDGHDFVSAALKAGAGCVLVTRMLDTATLEEATLRGAAVFRVHDAQDALASLAGAWRARLGGRVIGLTGSSGKTTTKNLVRDVLDASFAVTATTGNQNNELGVPNTLLSACLTDQAVVVEMGMRGMGQIHELCSFVRPDWGLVSNVGSSHMELLGSRENIARAKAELLESLPEGGWAFLNADCDFTAFMRSHARLDERGVHVALFDGSLEAGRRMGAFVQGREEVVGAGSAGDALVWAEDVALDEGGHPSFTLCARGFSRAVLENLSVAPSEAGEPPSPEDDTTQRVECRLRLCGMHNVSNACSAAAVGLAMGMPLQVVSEALSRAVPESGRAQVLSTASGVTVVDDSYNANPDSMRASLRTFAAMEVKGKKVAVLGDMGELGPFSEEGHRQVGVDAAQAGVEMLVCVGPLAQGIAGAATEAGLASEVVFCVADADEALARVKPLLCEGDAVLVKASHSVGLERVVEGLAS